MPDGSSVTTKGEGLLRSGFFARSDCQSVDLRYRVSRDKFDVPAFLTFFGKDTENEKYVWVSCRTLEPKELDYHIHFGFHFTAEGPEFNVSFHAGGVPKPADNEREPYAEQFMPWFGKFFTNETAHADLHAGFAYPIETRKSRFPLPLKLALVEDVEIEIRGFSATLTPAIEGIGASAIGLGKKNVTIDLNGTIRTDFSSFDLKAEVDRLSAVALKLTDGKEQ